MRVLAVGDIHGCHVALTTLLQQVKPTATDQIIFLGDYIDRGPASRDVIETLLGLSRTQSAIFLRGNHEIMALEARVDPVEGDSWLTYGGKETLHSYGISYNAVSPHWHGSIPAAHWEFLASTASYHETNRHIFVHACLDGSLELKDQSDWLLHWESFTRLQPHFSGKRVICGHSRQLSGCINDVGHGVCIDTGACYGDWLTCLDVNSGKYWQTNEAAETREGALI
jgi:serine/threonine protein phosphatase 1